MALPNPRTWTVDEYVEAADLNQEIRDAVLFFRDAPSCRVRNSAAILIANSTETALDFDTERWDNDAMHGGVNPSRLTAPEDGVYAIVAHVAFAPNATGTREVKIRLNGTTCIGSDCRPAVTTGNETRFSVPTQWKLAAGEWVDVAVFQSSGGNLNVQAGASYSPEFEMTWVSKG